MPGTATRGAPVELTDGAGVETGTIANPLDVNIASGGSGGGPATIADGADVTQGAMADASASTDTGTFSVIQLVKRLLQKFTAQVPATLTGGGNLKAAIVETTVVQPVGDNAGSLTVDAPAATPVAVAITDTADTLVKAGDAANNAVRVNIIAGAGSGGAAQGDKSAFTEGTTSFTPVGGVFNETISADPTEDQAAAARITAKRAVHTNLRNVAGTEVGTAAAPVRTDPTGTTTQPVSGTVTANAGTGPFAVQATAAAPASARLSDGAAFYDATKTGQLPTALVGGRLDTVVGAALPAGTNNIGDVDVLTLPALVAGTANIGDVDVLTLPAATNAGATAKTLDYDTGAGTDTVTTFGVLLPKSGGSVAGGTATDPLRTDPTGTTPQPVSAATLPLPTGAATEATLATRLTESGFDTRTGALTETAPATDTASSGLNGRLQRLAQRLSSLIALLPAALGGTTAANSLPVVLSSDGPFATQTGSVTETAPATDTASSGLNGRLQRIAQRLSSLIALLPTALVGGRLDVNVGASLPAGTNNIGDVDVLTLPALVAGTANIGDVDVLTLPALVAGTANIGDVDIVSGPTGASALQQQGDVAHDGVDSGNPVKVGTQTVAHGVNPTAVAAGDRSNMCGNRHGVLFTIGGHPNVVTIRANYTGAQTDAAIVTVASGLKIVVTRVTVTADNANTVDVAVRIGFGATTTPTTTGVVAAHPGIPSASGGGFTIGDGSGILGIGADGEDLRITSEVPTGGSIDVCVSYHTIES